jgi:hypothetical protein
MARTNRGQSNSGSRNNNPSGRNQYSDRGVMDLARERPVAAAAVAAGAAAAGLFLWSKRSQISNQLTNLSDQIGAWTDNMGSGSSFGASGDDTAGFTTSGSGATGTSRNRGMSETGGGNASFGASSGGGGSTSSASGRGRTRSTAPAQ